MKFCESCGKEILDDAIICPACGCPTRKYYQGQTQTSYQHSDYYPELCEYTRKINTCFVFSLISLITSMGVGLIFAIVAYVLSLNIRPFPYADKLTNPEEIDLYNHSEKKLKTSGTMLMLGGGINVVMWALVLLFAYLGAL